MGYGSLGILYEEMKKEKKHNELNDFGVGNVLKSSISYWKRAVRMLPAIVFFFKSALGFLLSLTIVFVVGREVPNIWNVFLCW